MKTQLKTLLPEEARVALAPLWKAFACSQDLKIDPWEFALPLKYLMDQGVAKSDLRWLVSHGYVTFRNRARRFLPSPNVAVSVGSRFMITEAGVVAAGFSVTSQPEIRSNCSQVPCWDRKRRQLSFGECVIKRFRLPASNQEAILTAFENECWPPSIDDPLPYLTRQRSKRRLHETIRHLNANHQNVLLRRRP